MAAARRHVDTGNASRAASASALTGPASPSPGSRALLWATSPRTGGVLGYGLPVMLAMSEGRERVSAKERADVSPGGTPAWLRSPARRGSNGAASLGVARFGTPVVDTGSGRRSEKALYVGAAGGAARHGERCTGTSPAEAVPLCLQPPRASVTHRLVSSSLNSPGGTSASSVRDGDAVVVTVADTASPARAAASGCLCLKTESSGDGAALDWTRSPAQACTFRVRLWSRMRGSPSQRVASPARLGAAGAAVVLGRGRRGSVRPAVRCGVPFTLECEAVPGRFVSVSEDRVGTSGGVGLCVGDVPAVMMAVLPGAVASGSARAQSFSSVPGLTAAKSSCVRTAASPMNFDSDNALSAALKLRQASSFADERKDSPSPVLMSSGRREGWLRRVMELPPRPRRKVLGYCRALKPVSLRLVCTRWRDRVDGHLTGFHMRHTFDEVPLRTRLRAMRSMLPRCVNLERLQLRDMADVDDASVGALRHLINLQVVSFSGCSGITDASVRFCVGLPGLRELDLSATAVTNDGVAVAASITTLEALTLYRCRRITNGCLHWLAAHPSLRTVNLRGTAVSDVSPGFRALTASASPHLRLLTGGLV